LDAIKASGGDDEAEDVIGGLRAAVNLKWHTNQFGSRVCYCKCLDGI